MTCMMRLRESFFALSGRLICDSTVLLSCLVIRLYLQAVKGLECFI